MLFFFSQISNEELYDMCVQGSEPAWIYIYHYVLKITRWPRWNLQDDPEDLAQTIVLFLLDKGLEQVRKPAAFRRFIKQVAISKILDSCKKKRPVPLHEKNTYHQAQRNQCPRLQEVLAWKFEQSRAHSRADLQDHLLLCPECSRIVLLVEELEETFEEPSQEELSLSSVPKNLLEEIRAYQRSQTAFRTREALEKLLMGRKGGQRWIEEFVKPLFSSRRPAPASRKDLTKTSRERQEDDSRQGQTTAGDTDPDPKNAKE